MLSLTEMVSYEKKGKLFEGTGAAGGGGIHSLHNNLQTIQLLQKTGSVQLYRFPLCLSAVSDMELTQTFLNDYMTKDLACGQDPQFVM